MITLRFVRNDGQVFSVTDTVWGLIGAKGLDSPELTVYTQKAAIGDGDLVTGWRVGARDIEFELKAKPSALNDVLRRAATSYFRSGSTYDVYVYRYGNTRYAPACYLEDFDIPTEKLTIPITLKLELLCPEGYFLSADSFLEKYCWDCRSRRLAVPGAGYLRSDHRNLLLRHHRIPGQ